MRGIFVTQLPSRLNTVKAVTEYEAAISSKPRIVAAANSLQSVWSVADYAR